MRNIRGIINQKYYIFQTDILKQKNFKQNTENEAKKHKRQIKKNENTSLQIMHLR